MAAVIHRVVMFKVFKPEEQEKLIEAYRVLAKDQQKDGKPYILSLTAGQAIGDPRSDGYTVVNKTIFASLDDMKYYDDECQAHDTLKTVAKGLSSLWAPPLIVYFEATVESGTESGVDTTRIAI